MGTKIFHQIKKWSFLVPLTTLFMLLSVMSYAQETQTVYNPVVTTDKLDYAPGRNRIYYRFRMACRRGS